MLQRLRETVRKIPRGKVSSYGAVARAAGYPGAARQVVWALRASSPGLPWHRVVGAGGRILLPGERGMEQRIRLEQEGVRFRGGRIPLSEHEHRFPGAGDVREKPARRRSAAQESAEIRTRTASRRRKVVGRWPDRRKQKPNGRRSASAP